MKSTLPIFLVFCNAVAVAELPLQELALPLILPVTSPARFPVIVPVALTFTVFTPALAVKVAAARLH